MVAIFFCVCVCALPKGNVWRSKLTIPNQIGSVCPRRLPSKHRNPCQQSTFTLSQNPQDQIRAPVSALPRRQSSRLFRPADSPFTEANWSFREAQAVAWYWHRDLLLHGDHLPTKRPQRRTTPKDPVTCRPECLHSKPKQPPPPPHPKLLSL